MQQAHAPNEVARCDLRVGVSAASVQDTCIEGLGCVCDLRPAEKTTQACFLQHVAFS